MEKKIEPSFRILSALAIIFVVAGHADFGVFDVAGMFPYYSFHVGVFVWTYYHVFCYRLGVKLRGSNSMLNHSRKYRNVF